MKYHSTVWTLSWDTRSGTNCRVFGSEREWIQFFSKIIESAIEGIELSEADEIRTLLSEGEVGMAYEIWQEYFKPELDTYNWDSQVITMDLSEADIQRIA